MPVKVNKQALQEAVDAVNKYNNYTEAAQFLNIPRSTLYDRMGMAARLGMKPIDLNPAENRVMTLEKETILLRDKVAVLDTKLKKQYRDQGIYQTLADEMQKITRPLDPLPRAFKEITQSEHVESLVLHLSDEHADEVVEAHRVGGLEEYNMSVALARAEHLVQKTISISKNTLSNYAFPELWILAYGDHVNGEIHDGTNHSEFRNVFDNTIATGQMHALMIRDLAPFFPLIKVLYLSGNHGRRTIKKSYKDPRDNWDYLVARTAQMMCSGLDNVEFLIPDSYSMTFDINGWNFCAFHGDDIKSWNSIPHYGIERKTRRISAIHAAQNRQIHYFVMGHFHNRSMLEHPNGEVLVNGPWIATNEYAYESLGMISKPSQLLHGVSRQYGVSFRFPIYLKFDGDTEGPKRYKAPLALHKSSKIQLL